MQLTYRVRAYPTRKQHALFADYLEHTRQLYNAALEERIDCYRKTGRTIGNNEQAKGLTELRQDEWYARYPRRMQRWAIDLVEIAYKGMFTRHGKGEKIGRPRFRGHATWSTIGWDSPIDFCMRERGLYNRKSLRGTLRLGFDRELPPFAACKFLVLHKDDHSRWFAHLTYEVNEPQIKLAPSRPVGVDVGLIILATRSDGVPMDAPRQSSSDTAEHRRASRALARCERRSKRRCRAKERLRRINKKIVRKRRARLHEISARLVRHFDAVAIEDLNLVALFRSGWNNAGGRGLRKAWTDRSAGQFADMIAWKCKRNGRQFASVNACNTSIDCAICGASVPKTLSDRIHICECGAVLSRDHNAALNILARAGWGPGDVKLSSDWPILANRRVGLSLKHGKDSRTTEDNRGYDISSIQSHDWVDRSMKLSRHLDVLAKG